jgi:uncharacterized membrane protein YgcG
VSKTFRVKILYAVVLAFFAACTPSSAHAALASKYENPDRSGAASKPAAVKQAAKSGSPQAAAQKEGPVVTKIKLPQKYINAMKKEHARFCEAYANAEMGLRYFFKTGYDADRGKKPPTEEEIKAMRFVIKLQMKDLASSARRYESNIRLARIAMMDMTPDEQAMFATALSQMLGTPASAGLFDSVSSFMGHLGDSFKSTAAAADTIANNVDQLNPSDYKTIGQRMSDTMAYAYNCVEVGYNYVASSYAANVVATGLKFVTGAVLMTAGLFAGATMMEATAPVVFTLGVILAAASVLGGGCEVANDVWTFANAVQGNEVNPKAMDVTNTISKWSSVAATVVNPGNGFAEVITNIAYGTKDFWIDWIMNADKPDTPGAKGAQDVKKAKESAGGGGGSGSDGGGSSGGCGGGCGGR